jgi:hypothetical protein
MHARVFFYGIEIKRNPKPRAVWDRERFVQIQFPLRLHDVINEGRTREILDHVGVLHRGSQVEVGSQI